MQEQQQEKPWTWDDKGKVKVPGPDDVPVEFQLIPGDLKKLAILQRRLVLCQEVTGTLAKARYVFENGMAEYENAARRLTKLVVEQDKAGMEQYGVARQIGVYFKPEGIADLFGDGVDALTAFAHETIDKLGEAAARKAMADKAPPAPKAEETPTELLVELKPAIASVEVPSATVAEAPAGA